MILRLSLALFMLFLSLPVQGWVVPNPSPALQPSSIVYLNPLPGAKGINPGVTLTMRLDANLKASDLTAISVQAVGSASGAHPGKLVLADDARTVIYQPHSPFSLGETVSVSVQAAALNLTARTFTFQIRADQPQPAINSLSSLAPTSSTLQPKIASTPQVNALGYVTLPADYPEVQVTTAQSGTGDGYLFLASFPWQAPPPPDAPAYLLILNNQGDPVYYQSFTPGGIASLADFKLQPNGLLTFYSTRMGSYVALDNTYKMVNTYQAGNGYVADLHDLQLFTNNHALLFIYDPKPMDMTAYGGLSNAIVVGLVIQELDANKNVVFEWRSWDHMNVTDTYVSLTAANIDYVHANAIELDADGNLLLSSRHLHEITKINRQTGDIIWRLGGKNNQFSFPNDPGFSWQHDIRRLPNGNITLFDNRTTAAPVYSRGVEYSLDEVGLVATRVWEYRNTPDTFGSFMGNVQRLPNGNSLIGWGSGPATFPMDPFPSITEVKADGTKVFELELPAQYVSYRGYRFPWHATPYWAPTLVVTTQGLFTPVLHYSWNGATDVASYKIYASGKNNPIPNQLIATQTKTAFEDSTTLTGQGSQYCYFRVMPVDTMGRDTRMSEVVVNPLCSQVYYLPMLSQN